MELNKKIETLKNAILDLSEDLKQEALEKLIKECIIQSYSTECQICTNYHDKGIKFDCFHNKVCKSCYMSINKCPLCRKVLKMKEI